MKSQLETEKLKRAKGDHELGRKLVNTICRQILQEGIVELDGKAEDQVLKELFDQLLKWSKQRPMMMSTDHQSGLLKQARTYANNEQFDEAFLFYATWFEHWINGVLTRRLRKIDEDVRRQMLRETSLKGKFKWLLPLIHEVEIPTRHIDTVTRIAEIRNSFVHYKFVMTDVDQWKDETPRALADLKRAEKTIKFLKRFETKMFLSPQAKKLIRKIEERDKPWTKVVSQ
jgi:hypothetical protein